MERPGRNFPGHRAAIRSRTVCRCGRQPRQPLPAHVLERSPEPDRRLPPWGQPSDRRVHRNRPADRPHLRPSAGQSLASNRSSRVRLAPPADGPSLVRLGDVRGRIDLGGRYCRNNNGGVRIVDRRRRQDRRRQQGSPADPSSGTPDIPGSIIEWQNGGTKTVATFGAGQRSERRRGHPPGIDGYTIGAGESGPSSDANHLGVTFGGSGHDLVDLGANEANNNPDQHQSYGPVSIDPSCLPLVPDGVKGQLERYTGIVDSNAYSLDVSLGGVLVTDAAANAVTGGPARHRAHLGAAAGPRDHDRRGAGRSQLAAAARSAGARLPHRHPMGQ